MPSEVLMDILRHLGNEEFKEYKWYLQKHDFLKDFPPIPKSRLEEADRMDTVDLMVQTYSHQYLEVNWKILRLMNRNDLLGTSDGGSGRRVRKPAAKAPQTRRCTVTNRSSSSSLRTTSNLFKLCLGPMENPSKDVIATEELEFLRAKLNLFAIVEDSAEPEAPSTSEKPKDTENVSKKNQEKKHCGETTRDKAHKSSLTHRQCTVWIRNTSGNLSLCAPSDFIFSGRCDTSLPATLQPSAVGQAVFAKTPHTACGSVGVFTYDLYNESTGRADKKMAVMFSVPYDFNLYSNWHAVGVFDRDTKCDRHLYNKMYQKTQKGFVRGKAKDPGLTYKDETVTITSTMTDSYEPVLELEISSTSNKVHPCHV